MALTVLVIEDHETLREALVTALGRTGDLRVVGEAGDAGDGVAAAAREQPDVIILDHHLPGRTGGDALAEIQASAPDARVVIWTSTPWAERLRRLPVARVLAKEEGLATLIETIREVGGRPSR